MSPVVISLLTSIAIFGILAVSLGLLSGHLGIFSMAHAALFGIGSYTFAFLTVKVGVDPILSGAVAIGIAGLGGLVMAIPALRVTGDYFLVASFAMQVVASSVFDNWNAVTGGTTGIPGILRPSFGSVTFFNNQSFLSICIVVLVLVTALTWFIVRSPFGRMLHVIRDDEVVAATLGKPIVKSKLVVTLVSGMFAGVAGILYAQYLQYISPGSFEVGTSVAIITMIIVGGMTSVVGTVVGAAIITLIPEAFKLLSLPPTLAGPLQQVFFGSLIIVLMFVRPQGIFGERVNRRRVRTLIDDNTTSIRTVKLNA